MNFISRRLGPLFIPVILFCSAVTLEGSVLTVTSLKDKNSGGTLRSALKSADDGDIIQFAPSLFTSGPQTIRLSSGLSINESVSIIGPGADLLAIDGQGSSQVFSITANCESGDDGTAVLLSGLTVRGGLSSGGGGVLVSKNSRLIVVSCRFEANQTKSNGGGSSYGGAIYNRGEILVDLSTFDGNLAGLASIPGNPGGAGGGLYNEGDAVVTRSLFVGNQAASGGGLASGGGTLMVESSTFSGNSDQSAAGGLFLGGGTTELINLTVVGNTSILGTGGVRVASGGLAEVRNSILADNGSLDVGTAFGGSFVSLGYNILKVAPSITALPSDKVGVDPKLGPLADNGGASWTHAPLAGSPALNGGDPVFNHFLQLTDQRGEGFPRVLGSAVDVGAYEEPNTAPTISCPSGTVECGVDLIVVTVEDADADLLTVIWRIGGSVIQTDEGVSSGESVFLAETPADESVIDVEVSDGSLSSSCTIAVAVLDRTPPDLSLNYRKEENGGLDPILVECGSAFVDPGATASDVCNGDIIPVVTGSVNTRTTGTYILTYTATDLTGNSTSKSRSVKVVDTTPPVLMVPDLSPSFDATAECLYALDLSSLGAGVEDICDPSPTIIYSRLTASGYELLNEASVDLDTGLHTIRIDAVDASLNEAIPVDVVVTIRDVTAPVVTVNGDAEMVTSCGDTFVDPGALATDGCDGLFAATSSGLIGVSGAGSYEVVYTAIDSAGNAAVPVKRVVNVLPSVSFVVSTNLTVNTDPGDCATLIDLSQLVEIGGTCVSDASLEVTILLPDGATETLDALEAFAFPKGTSTIVVRAFYLPYGPDPVGTSESFSITVEDPYLNCAGNIAWPVALDLEFSEVASLSSGSQLQAFLEQFLSSQGERRWIRIRNVPAGARLTVALSNPAGVNYDLTVYRDIQEAYDELLALLNGGSDEDKVSAVLGAQFSPEAFAPDAFAPDAFAPDAFAPDAFAPDAFAPDAFAPDAFAPDAFAPDAFAPDAFAPDAFAPDAFAPDAFAPDAFAPDAFAAAQNRVLASFSAYDGPTDGVRVTNFEETTDYYVRVSGRNGAFSTASTFSLLIEVETDICEGVVSDGALDPAFTGTVPSGLSDPTSLILWDSGRMADYAADAGELLALEGRLDNLAAAAGGVVVDVSTFANVNALNEQADTGVNVNCPYAKNLVAEAIRNIAAAYRIKYSSIGDITIVGNDDVIPFFRRSDDANLANEAQYFPPVLNSTHSQSALRTGRVLEQDSYGSECRVVLSTGEYNLPGAPVGRLVEEAGDVIRTIDTYLPVFSGSTPGVLPAPAGGYRALSVAYDFMADAGEAIADEFRDGLNLGGGDTVNTLISDPSLAPSESWTAGELSGAFYKSDRLNLIFIGAHGSTASALAADYTSRFTAAELEAATVDITYAIAASQACHLGYNTVDPDAVPSVTLRPDWAQAFARKGAIFLAGTGYQYGETQLLEYGERLYLEFWRQLRTGSAPVSVGQAMVNAKLAYLAKTPNMRGIHEKTLLVGLTLYGLPMVRINLPGGRLPAAGGSGGGLAVASLGGSFGLATADLEVTPELTRKTLTLDVVGQSRTVDASYYLGSDGAVSLVAEPIRPLESEAVGAASGALLRGVVLRSATYVDETPFLPLTGAPATEIRGVAAPFKSEVFYPIIPWATNQIGELCGGNAGGTVLNAFPAQFRSDLVDPAVEAGLLRKYTGMSFGLFYSDSPSGENPAQFLTPAPAVNGVAAELSADGSEIVIEAVIETSAAVGIHEVLATYTGEPGSPWHGAWHSVYLSPTSSPLFFPGSVNADGIIRTWTASIPVSGYAADFRFIIQTVGNNGPALQSTNFGRYYRVGGDLPTGETATAVTIVTAPATGAYGTTILVEADVRSGGDLLGDGERVDFRLGPIARSVLTVGGRASAELTLYAAPQDYALEVSYRGSSDYAPSSATQPFAVVKQDSTMEFDGVPEYSRPSDWFVRLQTTDGKPLKEKSVVFVIENMDTAESFIVSEITDGAGRAAPGSISLENGEYAVAAYFAAPEIPSTEISLVDPLYNASTTVGVFAVTLETTYSAESGRLTYDDVRAEVSEDADRGLSSLVLSGVVGLADASIDPSSLLSDPHASQILANLLVRVAGESLVDSQFALDVSSSCGGLWQGSWAAEGFTAQLEIQWGGEVTFDSRLTNPVGPTIRSDEMEHGGSEIEFKAASGDYTVTFTDGKSVVRVTVRDGRVKSVSGLGYGNCVYRSKRREIEFRLPYALADGQVIAINGCHYDDVVVTAGANLLTKEGRFNLEVTLPPGTGPLYSETPAILEAIITVGAGSGETPATGGVTVGDATNPWSEESAPLYRALN
ncbi:MAG: DUF5011 domain-containing protein [Opitutaceae bacterium]